MQILRAQPCRKYTPRCCLLASRCVIRLNPAVLVRPSLRYPLYPCCVGVVAQGFAEAFPPNPKVVADMTALHHIHEAGILHNLGERSKLNGQRPYTFMVSFAGTARCSVVHMQQCHLCLSLGFLVGCAVVEREGSIVFHRSTREKREARRMHWLALRAEGVGG